MMSFDKKNHNINLLTKLRNREISGLFKRNAKNLREPAKYLFNGIPDRLMFHLKNVLHLGNQILMGTTQCGQFLITYSFSNGNPLQHSADFGFPPYKYKLHWWAFRPFAAAVKVGEVQLFGDFEIRDILSISIAQWPSIPNKIVACGYYNSDTPVPEEDRKAFITITTLPALHSCYQCKLIAASFDAEDFAANWDSCISMRCVKHGLTVHTSFNLSNPNPTLDLSISLKAANRIVFNTGVFLHVLSVDLDDPSTVPPSQSLEQDSIVNSPIEHKLGANLEKHGYNYVRPFRYGISTNNGNLPCDENDENKLSANYLQLKSPVPKELVCQSPGDVTSSQMWCAKMPKLAMKPVPNKTKVWRRTILDQAEKVYAFEESDDGCNIKFKWFRRRRLADKMYEFHTDDDVMDTENVHPIAKKSACHLSNERNRVKSDSFVDELFQSDNDHSPSENESDFVLSRVKCRNFQTKNASSCDSLLMKTDSPNLTSAETNMAVLSNAQTNELYSEGSDKPRSPCEETSSGLSKSANTPRKILQGCFSELSIKTDFLPEADAADVNSIIADWESLDTLSPRSEVSDKYVPSCESRCDAIRSFLENIPGTVTPQQSGFSNYSINSRNSSKLNLVKNVSNHKCYPPSYANPQSNLDSSVRLGCDKGTDLDSDTGKVQSSMRVVLRPQNQNLNKWDETRGLSDDAKKPKCSFDKNKSAKISEGKTDRIFGRQLIPESSVKFDRKFTEVDEEIISTITDIEDDEQGTIGDCALAVSVHGSGYTQMEMISNQKAGKLNIPVCTVRQVSCDIEQFCSRVADIICKCEGFKFWFCNDYDVEIVDVCPLNGDILLVLCMWLNAELMNDTEPRASMYKRRKTMDTKDPRLFFEVKCLFTWSSETGECWLEGYSPLNDVKQSPSPPKSWRPAHQEAKILRGLSPTILDFYILPQPTPVRLFTHCLWDEHGQAFSVEEIRDVSNLVGFMLQPRSSDDWNSEDNFSSDDSSISEDEALALSISDN
nr:PREDICTED: uncharacterized protein LOC109034107 [Bemisia tabaci]